MKPDSYAGFSYDSGADKFHLSGTEIDFPAATYESFAYADEARCFALGAQAGVGGRFSTAKQADLQTVWPPDNSTDDPANKYSDHKWHSAEFNFDNMQQGNFWSTILGSQGFNL